MDNCVTHAIYRMIFRQGNKIIFFLKSEDHSFKYKYLLFVIFSEEINSEFYIRITSENIQMYSNFKLNPIKLDPNEKSILSITINDPDQAFRKF